MKLSEILKQGRERKGWSLDEASVVIGVSKGHLHDMENDKANNPTIRTVAAISIAYHIPAEQLVATAVNGLNPL